MNTVSFRFLGKTRQYSAPSSWEGLTAFHLKAWILVLYATMPDEKKLELAVPIFYNLKPWVNALMPNRIRVQIAPTLRFLFRENRLCNWLLPTLRVRFTTYYGPASRLSNVAAGEFFQYTEVLYWKYRAKPDADTLHALIAALYRPKAKGSAHDDLREPLTDLGIAWRAKTFARLPAHIKQAILFNYEGCRNYITATHPKAFAGKGGGTKRGDITLTLAEGRLEALPEVRKTNLYTFLLRLEQLIEQEEALKELRNK